MRLMDLTLPRCHRCNNDLSFVSFAPTVNYSAYVTVNFECRPCCLFFKNFMNFETKLNLLQQL